MVTKKTNENAIKPEDVLIPKWASVLVHYIRIGISLFLLATVAIGLISCSTPPVSPWVSYSLHMSNAEAKKILAENSIFDEKMIVDSLDRVRVRKIDKAILVDLGSEDLCGISGCLYLGYRRYEDNDLKEVFRAYLDGNLPPEYALFDVSLRTSEEVSCFLINQVRGIDIDRHTMCFDGDKYAEVDLQSIPSGESI